MDYIEENLKEDLTVDKIAEITGFSPYHYYRLFNSYVGMPVMQYIRRRRLLHRINDLAARGKRIIDVAMEYGFSTHSGFTKAFTKEYGCSPSKYISNVNGSIPRKINLMLLKKYNLMTGPFPGLFRRPGIIYCMNGFQIQAMRYLPAGLILSFTMKDAIILKAQ